MSKDTPDAARIKDNPVPKSRDEILPWEQPAITETSSEASTEETDMEQRVSAFLSEAVNGMALVQLTEYVHLTDIACDAEALMLSIIGKGMIRNIKNKCHAA